MGCCCSCYHYAEDIVEEINKDNLWEGKVAIVTGATSGFGFKTAEVLISQGLHVILAGRNKDLLIEVTQEFLSIYPDAKIDIIQIDLSSLSSVRKFVDTFLELEIDLHILINNAGIMATPYFLSHDGYEGQVATNFIGHALLTDLLLPKLKECSPSRIINVSSKAHRMANLTVENVDTQLSVSEELYNPFRAYGNSKLCNILHARYLANTILKDSGVSIFSLHPGVGVTQLQRYSNAADCFYGVFGSCFPSISQGAATTVYCALAPGIEKLTGQYFHNCEVAKTSPAGRDDELAEKVWLVCHEMIKRAAGEGLY